MDVITDISHQSTFTQNCWWWHLKFLFADNSGFVFPFFSSTDVTWLIGKVCPEKQTFYCYKRAICFSKLMLWLGGVHIYFSYWQLAKHRRSLTSWQQFELILQSVLQFIFYISKASDVNPSESKCKCFLINKSESIICTMLYYALQLI